jgi:hypothetical protein
MPPKAELVVADMKILVNENKDAAKDICGDF